ncbi:glycosyltransferase [Luteithermobacter gelatinilyticus]|uniref:glycosyltransferase n=1 Tax=Luteithermobacter gelatinilyticus TaxID=2582913 RepID=UPI001106CD27|nr:glycosyltransferase [Luteithermobacter gelatinilyticus]
MKILIFSNYSGYFGSEKSLEDIFAALKDNNCVKTYMNPSVEIPSWYRIKNNVRCVDMNVLSKGRMRLSLNTVWKISQILRNEKPDKVIVNISLMPEVMFACRIMGIKLYVFVRESLSDYPKLYWLYRKFLIWVSEKLITNSKYTSMMLNGRDKVSLLYNRIDPPEGFSLETALAKTRYDYDLTFVGRLSERKGVLSFLSALNVLDSKLERTIKVAFVGNVKRGEEYILSRIFQAQADFKRVKITLFEFQNDPYPLIQASRALVAPSLLPETFGRILIEGCCVGTPVVSSDSGAYSEINPLQQLVFNRNSESDFVNKLEYILKLSTAELKILKKKAIISARKYQFENFKKTLVSVILND